MKGKDIKFIHIISIVIVIYNNGINLKILMSHWRHLTTTFKFPQVPCIVSLDNVRIHKQLSSSILANLHQLDSAPYVSRSHNAQ